MISCVVPVSPSLGKMRVMLLVWASAFMSVMASMASVTLNPARGLARGRLDADAGGHAGDHHLRDAAALQILLRDRCW